ncbi:hypothetical protein MSG28_002278 [Choristoneura fumiferana]|uniref:Uncharacterized protein n=1 Tax=Choristoneura fumiferana TaxID=7141 RepID=A0ACC0JV75_CHOFU|nr:hypothetical protein MSG28_002278 [Choristoneura fumiferana]
MKFLKDPARKIELYNKVYVPPAPPMTKAEQILIYIVSQLKICWSDIVENILKNIEYSLFMLNRTPEFEAIETLSHFYAVLCRYDKNRNRLRLFIIDAMYCLQYKAVPLIRQCLDVWMHILPLAHMGIVEKKMLRMALIILAKRHGARWCQNYIVKNMLLPIMEQSGAPERVKCFCVSLLGPLLKPYPMEMKVNCEIVMNQLSDMLNRNPSKQMEEAIFTSLIYMSRHNQNRVIKALLFWKPENISLELEDLLKSYVKERPMKLEWSSGSRARVGGGYQRLEWQAGTKHVLDEGGSRDKVFELEIEDTLEPLHGQRAQLWQRAQHAAEVRRAAAACAVRHVRTQASDYLHLQLLHPMSRAISKSQNKKFQSRRREELIAIFGTKFSISRSFLNGPLEKSFASFASPDSIVLTSGGVPANGAKLAGRGRRGAQTGAGALGGHAAGRARR